MVKICQQRLPRPGTQCVLQTPVGFIAGLARELLVVGTILPGVMARLFRRAKVDWIRLMQADEFRSFATSGLWRLHGCSARLDQHQQLIVRHTNGQCGHWVLLRATATGQLLPRRSAHAVGGKTKS